MQAMDKSVQKRCTTGKIQGTALQHLKDCITTFKRYTLYVRKSVE